MTEGRDEPSAPNPWWLAGLAVLIALGGLAVDVADWHGNLFDDAYIYLRYAENNLNGCMLEWNCGAGRVEGFTSPLYLVLLTVAGLVVDLEAAASWLGVVLWGLAIGGFVVLPVAVRDRLGPAGPLAGVASLAIAVTFVADQLLAINIASGMEGGLVASALLAVAWLAFRPERLAVVAPATVLVRPELGLATLLQPLLGRDHLRRAAIAAVVGFGAITVLRFVLFTDVLPNTFWAKSGGSAHHLAHGAGYLLESASRFAPAVLVVLGFFSSVRALRYLAAVVVGWAAYFLWSGGDFYPFARLFAFLVPLAVFVGVTATCELAARLGTRRAVAIVAIVVVVSTALGRQTRDSYQGGAEAFDNVRRWAATGTWLRRCLPNHAVAAVPIGAIAYYSKAPVLDMVGLTDPIVAIDGARATAEDFVVGHERAHPEWTLSLEPSVVFLNVHGAQPIDSRQKLQLMFAEGKLLTEIARSGRPYVSVSAPVSPGVFQLLFVRKPVAMSELQPACLEPPPKDAETP